MHKVGTLLHQAITEHLKIMLFRHNTEKQGKKQGKTSSLKIWKKIKEKQEKAAPNPLFIAVLWIYFFFFPVFERVSWDEFSDYSFIGSFLPVFQFFDTDFHLLEIVTAWWSGILSLHTNTVLVSCCYITICVTTIWQKWHTTLKLNCRIRDILWTCVVSHSTLPLYQGPVCSCDLY